MATYTPNYNLYKPDGTDQFDNFLTEFGNNMDTIDANLGGGGGSSTLAGLSDVNLTSPVTNDALIYDGAEWVNSPLSAVAFSGDYSDLSNAPAIPTKTSDLYNDSDFVSDSAYVHTDNNFTNADVTKLSGIQAGAEVNVQSDWNEADNTADDYIKNKPTIPINTSDLNNDSGFLDSSDITVTQVQTTGTKIATIDVDGNSTDLYAPTGGGGSYTAGDGIDITSNTISVDTTFTEASTRANINSGDTFSTILGKIKKFFTDLKAVAFSGSYNDLSDKPTIPVGSDYVQKSGDTMTGALNIKASGQVPLTLDRSHSSTTSQRVAFDVGNNIAEGTAGSTYGDIALFGKKAFYTVLTARDSTTNRNIYLPDKDGTVALTSDIPDISGKVNKSGDTMTGTLKIDGGNGIQLMNGAMSTMLYQQAGPVAVANLIEMPNESGTLALKSNITSGTCAYINAPRKNSQNLNDLPSQNKARVDECNSNSSNLPSADWHYVLTAQGSDTNYAGQLAMGMEKTQVFYRRKSGGSWFPWESLIPPTFSVITQQISISALSPLGESYDQDFSWSATYTIMGIVGYQLEGNKYTRCCFNRMSFRNGASKHIYYSIRNTSTTDTTGALTLTVQLLTMS